MKLGIRKEKYNDLNEISNLLKLNKSNCNIKSPDFYSKITCFTKPFINKKFVPLHFELRGNYEVCAIGAIEDILDFFKLTIVEEIPNGYRLGIKKEGDTKAKWNPKSYKFYANECKYNTQYLATLKKDLNLDADTKLYFYRSEIVILDEQETAVLLKSEEHYENFNKVAIHEIRKQKKYHKIFNLPYKLNINATIIDDNPIYENETSLSFKIEEDNSISLSGTYEHVYNFIEQEDANITFNITNNNSVNNSENKWSFKNIFSSTFKNNIFT